MKRSEITRNKYLAPIDLFPLGLRALQDKLEKDREKRRAEEREAEKRERAERDKRRLEREDRERKEKEMRLERDRKERAEQEAAHKRRMECVATLHYLPVFCEDHCLPERIDESPGYYAQLKRDRKPQISLTQLQRPGLLILESKKLKCLQHLLLWHDSERSPFGHGMCTEPMSGQLSEHLMLIAGSEQRRKQRSRSGSEIGTVSGTGSAATGTRTGIRTRTDVAGWGSLESPPWI